GDLIIKELLNVAEIDYVAKAPDGKEVEELAKKEIHKALRGKMPVDQAKHEISTKKMPPQRPQRPQQQVQRRQPMQAAQPRTFVRKSKLKEEEKKTFKSLLEDLVGTQGAYILDEDLNILGKVPITELASTVKSLSSGIYAIIFSGTVEKELVQITERAKVQYLVTMESKIKPEQARVNILTMDDL
ncbi:DNA primase, partial [Candidatus Woesearchaeota archaeon]|nr:DNA primase [Candidatus Woesearchaeota archaeon]